MLRAEAVGGAERLVNRHRKAPPSASVVPLARGGDGHERDGVRDPGVRRVRQRHGRHDGLVVTVTAAVRRETGNMIEGLRKAALQGVRNHVKESRALITSVF